VSTASPTYQSYLVTWIKTPSEKVGEEVGDDPGDGHSVSESIEEYMQHVYLEDCTENRG
jgi:hypothetical protein